VAEPEKIIIITAGRNNENAIQNVGCGVAIFSTF
jgi:hypothetical protein